MTPANRPTVFAIVFLGICILIHGGVLLISNRRQVPDDWLYQTYGGHSWRTSKTTGEIFESSGQGWLKRESIR